MIHRGRPHVTGSLRLLAAVLLAAGLTLSLPSAAQSGSRALPGAPIDGPPWTSLTPAQKSALAPLKRDWPSLDAPRKQKWLDIAARFSSMPADERERVQERMTQWSRMTPDERGRTRLQFQETRKISPQDRQERWDDYMALPIEARQSLSRFATSVPKAPKPTTPSTPLGQPAKPTKSPVPQPALKPVAPTIVQARPGATTTLISNTAQPPAHAKDGQPKIAATPDVVDRATLLPQAGPQGAAVVHPPATKAPAEAGTR